MNRQRLQDERYGATRRFQVLWPNGEKLRFYVTVSEYEDGCPGEIAIHTDSVGSFASGLLRAIAQLTSLALQYGAPIESIICQWRHGKFPPEGFTGDRDYARCTSLLDLVAQWLHDRYGRTTNA